MTGPEPQGRQRRPGSSPPEREHPRRSQANAQLIKGRLAWCLHLLYPALSLPQTLVRIAVVFDSPWTGYTPEDHARQMTTEVEAKAETEPEQEYQIANALVEMGHEVFLYGVTNDLAAMLEALAEWKPEVVVNAAEGFRGQSTLDYLFGGLLEANGYRYTGSPPLSVLVTRNKAMAKEILGFRGVRTPGFVTYGLSEIVTAPPELPFPLIVKPLQADASEGIAKASVVTDQDELADRVEFVHGRFRQPALAEEFIDGRELYVGMLGNGEKVEILPITEMIFDKDKTPPTERIATQAAKWDEPYRARRGIKNVLARPISKGARAKIEETCRVAYHALWLRDYARLDVRLTPEDDVWLLEANANPFISKGHEMAAAAEKHGLEYPAFIQRIVDEALGRP
jgi:D-alanine-D-alanine ligase